MHKDTHNHNHEHGHEHAHGHAHNHEHEHEHDAGKPVLTVRAMSGLSGDIMLAGLALMLGVEQNDLDRFVADVGLGALTGSIRLERRSVNDVQGVGCAVTLPHEHAHRTLADIAAIIQAGAMTDEAKRLALAAFTLLAQAEGAVHDKKPEAVTFHEVGALDSILDICVCCSLYAALAPAKLVCSPLPLADGHVWCAHGCLPVPAPAVLRLLEGVPVSSFAGQGETVTPTAMVLLKAFGATFGGWPDMIIEKTALVHGSRRFANAPNGAVWARGRMYKGI